MRDEQFARRQRKLSRVGLGACALGAFALLLQAGCGRTETKPVATAAKANAAAVSGAAPRTNAIAAAKLSFNEHIQPILAENCYACHGTDASARKGELRLDRAEFAFAPRKDSGPAIVKGDADKSPLVQRIESQDEKLRMPPPEAHKTLKPEQIATLRRWISEGAEYEEHWAFIAPKRPVVPEDAETRRPGDEETRSAKSPRLPISAAPRPAANPIDAFVRAKLSEHGLAPSPEADRRSLIRRASLDLTGLPPTPEEVDAFVADKSPEAYARVVDRLLASPRFGEHRARYWLDYVRYADTHGIHIDNYRAIWPYRDYVIRAFNANKPFDRFVREQLAGDLLPAKTFEELAATGFMRCNLTTNEGGTIPEETRVNELRDRVEAFGVTFLGLTTGCAACHDHKFDPVSQRDFYQLAAFLGNTEEKPWDLNIAEPPPVLRQPKPENLPAAEVVLARRAELQAQLEARRARSRELAGEWLASGKRPREVDCSALEVRLRFDEGNGDVVKNSAPEARTKTFKAETNPLVWRENSWLWPSMRMDIFSRLSLGENGDVEASEKFSAGGWIMLRAKPGGGVRTGTGSGTLFGRMGEEDRKGGAGWDLFHENLQLTFTLAPEVEPGAEPAPANIAATVQAVATPPAKATKKGPARPAPNRMAAGRPPGLKRGLQVATRLPTPDLVRDEWVHVFLTYDGSRKAAGVKIYLNGRPVPTDVKLDTLAPKDSIRTDAEMHIGRRDDFLPMRETRYQDFRFYRRALSADEVTRLPFETIAAEIVARQPDPKQWTTDEAFVVAEKFFLGEIDKETRELAAAVAAHDSAFEALTQGGVPSLIAIEKTTPAYADVLKRGDYYARLERVGPGTPHFLPPLPKDAPQNRRGLADWLAAPENPLFARVTVNRAWQEIFGRGLVETAGDFGVMGSRPTHPELLDWLAVEFRESGWDVKKLYRLLVMSATYRQSANVTPDRLAKDEANKLLSRGPRFRMDAEVLRDSALAVSGLLVEKIGGPPAKPYQPPGIWEEVAMPNSDTRVYVPDKGDGLYRRSVYTFWKRSSAPPSMETFDATSREIVCTRRARTNTPLQAFVTMNDPQWVEAARKLAERALRASPADDSGRIQLIARLALARELQPPEIAVVAKSLEKYRTHFAGGDRTADVQALLSVGESPADEKLNPNELAQWTLVASEFLNLDEFLTK